MQALMDRVSRTDGVLARAADRLAGKVLRPAEASACTYYGRACCASTCHICDRLYCSGQLFCSNCRFFCC